MIPTPLPTIRRKLARLLVARLVAIVEPAAPLAHALVHVLVAGRAALDVDGGGSVGESGDLGRSDVGGSAVDVALASRAWGC